MKLNRRKVLASVGMIGGGAAIGGVGTRAYLFDDESVTATTTAGTLDIQLDWKAIHNGDVISSQLDPVNADGTVAAHFKDVKPGDTGCFSLSIHNETNPAWVWFAMDIVDESDGDTDDGEEDPQEVQCPAETYPLVCGDEAGDGSVTVEYDSEDNLVVVMEPEPNESFDETQLHVTNSEDGIPQNAGSPQPGQFEYDDTDATEDSDGTVTYEIPGDQEEIECGDKIVIAAHAAQSDGDTCTGGSTEGDWQNWWTYIKHTICCPDNGEESSDGEEETSENTGDGSVLADNIMVDLFWDDDEDCEIDDDETVLYENVRLRTLTDHIEKSTGGVMPEWYSEGTQYISLPWEIPIEVGNEIQGDELTLEFCVYAVQRRHNDNPDNPWV